MDTLWECMNVASRITKQIENMESLVPQNFKATCTPVADLQELSTTLNSVRSTLVPFVTSSKKKPTVSDGVFDICIKGMKDTLNDLFLFFKDLEKDFSVNTWKTAKIRVFRLDFLLKQKLDQFVFLFKGTSPVSLITDADGAVMWEKSFGAQAMMVPWPTFFTTLQQYLGVNLKEDEEHLKMAVDFTKKDQVSAFEFGVFLQWFAPLKGSTDRYLEALRSGHLAFFMPAVEAQLLLEGKREGTYLIRFSKTKPGSFAVTFVDSIGKIKHCLLHSQHPYGVTLKSPPTVYASLKEFAESHQSKLKYPLGNKYTLNKKLPGYSFDGKIPEGPETPSSHVSSEGSTCVVCMDAPFETVFLECGHLACCSNCSTKLKLCPICRNPIVRCVPVFRAT